MTEPTDLDAARAVAAEAQVAPDMRKKRKRASSPSEDREPDLFPLLPPDCPVTALGTQGKEVWVLEGLAQMYSLKPRELDKGQLMLMFGGEDYLVAHWPEKKVVPGTGKKGEKPEFYETGDFNQNDVQRAIIKACWVQGIFKPQGKVFGRGAHRGNDVTSEIILHLGNRVLSSSCASDDWRTGGKRGAPGQVLVREARPGKLDGKIYPADDALPAPAMEPSSWADGMELLDLLGRWPFADGYGARILFFGMIWQMFICGAEEWRAHGWIKAATGSGKTTLLRLIMAIHGGRNTGWVLYSNDATEAGIRQLLDKDTLPVILDEAEAADGPERQRALLNLIKKSSSEGGNIVRGGADHKASEFTAQSCFLAASVLHAPMLGEDRNRIVIYDMLSIPKDAPPMDLRALLPHWQVLGRRMHRRMLEQWPRFDVTWECYKREIARHGFTARWQDTYGTLLACADCGLFDEAPPIAERPDAPPRLRNGEGEVPVVQAWVAAILPILATANSEARPDDERILPYLQYLTIPGANGAAAETVGEWLMRAIDLCLNADGYDQPEVRQRARERLKTYGLRVVTISWVDDDKNPGKQKRQIGDAPADCWDSAYLAVASASCRPLCDLFKDSKEWMNGGWMQSFAKVKGAQKDLRVRFTGKNPDVAIAIPLAKLKGDE